MYNVRDYSNNYSKISGSLRKYYKDEPVLTNAGVITDFIGNDTNDSFNFKEKITGQIGGSGTKDIEIMVPFKYLSNFWRGPLKCL